VKIIQEARRAHLIKYLRFYFYFCDISTQLTGKRGRLPLLFVEETGLPGKIQTCHN
jgi:hypothetical protein